MRLQNTFHVSLRGAYLLHGVTNRVQLPLEGRLVRDQVVGSVVLLADYGISRPTEPLVLAVSEEATIEVQLVFRRT